MSRWICVVALPGGKLVGVTDGVDDGTLANWPTEEAARRATVKMMIVEAYGAVYFEV